MLALALIYWILSSVECGKIVSSEISEFRFNDAITAEYNKTLANNLTIYDNIYIEFNMKLTKNAYRKPKEIDNVFHIATHSNDFILGVFVNIQQQRVFAKLSQKDRFDFVDVPHFDNMKIDQLCHWSFDISQTWMKIMVNDSVIYNQAINEHETNVNKTLYLANPWNNAANADISNFTFISTNDKITTEIKSKIKQNNKHLYIDEKMDKPQDQDGEWDCKWIKTEPKPLGKNFSDILNWNEADVQRWINETKSIELEQVDIDYLNKQQINGKSLLLMYEFPEYFNEFTKSLKSSEKIRFHQHLNELMFKMEGKNDVPVIDYQKHRDQCGYKETLTTSSNTMIDTVNIKKYFYTKLTVSMGEDPYPDFEDYDQEYYGMYDQSSDDDDTDYGLDSEYEFEKPEYHVNIFHVGVSLTDVLLKINFDSDTGLVFQLRGLTDQPKFEIERETKYKIEIYMTPTRYQIAVNKKIIFDATRYQRYQLNNIPIFMSNPWEESTELVEISDFGMVSSELNVTRGEKMAEYPYKYCLRSYKEYGHLDGKWTPYGYHNNHTLFYKSYLKGIKGMEWVYLFYYKQSWRMYLDPYNTTDSLNPDKYFAICNIDDYNPLKCAGNFNFRNGGINRDYRMKAGVCTPKKANLQENTVEWIQEYFSSTTTPTPIEDDSDYNIHDQDWFEKFEDEAERELEGHGFWWIFVLFVVVVCCGCLYVFYKKHGDQEKIAEKIIFNEEGYYKSTTLIKGEDELDMEYDYDEDEDKDIRDLETDCNGVIDEVYDDEEEDVVDTVQDNETDEF